MTRIRYTKGNNTLTSNGLMLLGTRPVIVQLNTEALTMKIMYADNSELVLLKRAPSLPTLKMKTKRILRELGVQFDNEIRVRGNVQKLVVVSTEDNAVNAN